MAVYAISYDLHKKGEVSYENLIKTIKAYGNWCHYLESDWMIISSNTAVQIRDALRPHIHQDDKLIVFKVASGPESEAAWHNLPSDVSEWLRLTLK